MVRFFFARVPGRNCYKASLSQRKICNILTCDLKFRPAPTSEQRFSTPPVHLRPATFPLSHSSPSAQLVAVCKVFHGRTKESQIITQQFLTQSCNLAQMSDSRISFSTTATQPHQNLVGLSLQTAQTTLSALQSSGVKVRVVQPGQVPICTPPFCQLAMHSPSNSCNTGGDHGLQQQSRQCSC
jgi:hypothetical protein